MKKDTWVLVANSSFAKFYKAEKNNKLIEVGILEHPESRLHDQDLISTEKGRTFSRMGTMRSSMEFQTSAKVTEYHIFAKEISNFLDAARETGKFGKLYLAASPSFLGILRQTISRLTGDLVVGQIDRDMTHLKPDEIRNHLPLVL